MEASLRKLAFASEDWKGAALERWESAFGATRLRELIAGEAAGRELPGAGGLRKDRESLTGACSERVTASVAAGESWGWDSQIDGDGALCRWVDLDVGAGASVSILRACRSGLFKEIWRVRLAAGARFEMRVAAALKDGAACEMSSWVTHAGSNGQSAETAFFALGDGAFGAAVARVDIEPGTTGANATQLARALHGGRGSRSYLRPWMKMGSDDIAASHGAASGAVDADQALYLASRGIEEKEASALLSAAFARQAFDESCERSLAMINFLESSDE